MEMFCVPSRIWSAQLERLYDRGFLLILYLYTLYRVSRPLCQVIVTSIGSFPRSNDTSYSNVQFHTNTRGIWYVDILERVSLT